jgi:hypothetical protein
MAIPNAPVEGGLDKMLFLVYDDGGANAAALIRGIGDEPLNGETVAHLAVASQVDGQTHGSSAPLVMIGGSDGTVTRKALVDAAGRLVTVSPTNVFKSFSALAITSEATVWTPTTGKKFRLMGFVITQNTLTGDITVKDGSGGSTILTIPATPVGQPLAVPLGQGILSAAANNLLRVIGASTETISGFVYGTEE